MKDTRGQSFRYSPCLQGLYLKDCPRIIENPLPGGFLFFRLGGIIKAMLKNNIQKNRLGQQTGFMLIELLVVISIIGLLSTLVLANHRSGQKKYALSQATQQLVSNLREAQNMAMSGVDIETEQYYGYGFYLNKVDNFYIIYADKNDNTSYQPSDTIIETVNLPSQIKINSLSPLANKIDIFFKPPEPTTYINADSGTGVSGAITLELEGTSLTKTVAVTTAGLIYSN